MTGCAVAATMTLLVPAGAGEGAETDCPATDRPEVDQPAMDPPDVDRPETDQAPETDCCAP